MEDPVNETIKKNYKALNAGIVEALNVLQPPKDLRPGKRATYLCLVVATLGIIGLVYLRAPWFAYIAYVFVVTMVAILVGAETKK